MEQKIREQGLSVKKMLLKPFMAGMTALLVLISIGLYSQYITYYETLTTSSHSSAIQLYEHSIAGYQATMGGILEILAADSRVIPLMEAGDRDRIQSLYRPLFERLQRKYSLDDLLFISADSHVLTRLHRPAEYGDPVLRPSLKEATNNRSFISGFDASTRGRLTLRVVAPVFDADLAVGFIEAAMDVNDIFYNTAQPQHLGLAFALNKSRLTRERIRLSRAMDSPDPFWVDADADVLFYTSIKDFDSGFAREIMHYQAESNGSSSGQRFSFFHKNTYFVVSALPLKNSLGIPLGKLYVIENATHIWNDYIGFALFMLGASLFIIVSSRCVIGNRLARADRRISEILAQIKEGELIFENVFAQSETGFVLINWQTGDVHMANRVALSIFNAVDASDISITKIMPLSGDNPLQAEWEASGATNPLMAISTDIGTAYCEITQFYIGANEELQCLAIRDVSELVKLQYDNRRHIEYLQAIIDQLPGNVCIKDSDLRLILYNAAFARFFGNKSNMVGHIRHSEWLGGSMDYLMETDRQALATGDSMAFEVALPAPDGNVYTHMVAKQRITSKDGSHYVLSVGTDITERKNMEMQLIRLRQKAEEANTAKSQFLARMSHEIRTPMNVILGMSHLALNADPDERQKNYLDKIHGAAKNLLGIINDILDFSKIEAGEMTLENIPFALNDILADINAQMQTLVLGRPIAFLLSTPDFENEFLGDPLRIRQVLLNLANNAIKFTHDGSVRIVCEVKAEGDEESDIYFAVEDTGIGIPKEGLERLFVSFQQVDGSTTRKYGGTGLGLAISQQFVNLMGGRIEVRSIVNKGSTFFFVLTLAKAVRKDDECSLPGVAAAWQEFHGKENKETPTSLPPAKVLVVEDNEINQEIIIELLQGLGLEVTAVGNGREALDIIEQQVFDIVLMDLQMPVMDGLEATRAIRALDDARVNRVPVIALTANAMNEDRDRCLDVGMDDFLSKPIDVAELNAKLERWLVMSAPDDVS